MGPKKKKGGKAVPAVNRGFATTSIPSKNKQIEDDQIGAPAETKDAQSVVSDVKPAQSGLATSEPTNPKNSTEKELYELTPDELNARLEVEALQSFVDKYAAKAQRDATRQLTKTTTENRLLRAQAELLNLRSLVPADALREIAALAAEDVAGGFYQTTSAPAKPTTRTEDVADEHVARLWGLQRALQSLGFAEGDVEGVLRHLTRCPPQVEQGGHVWAFEEALDWLALNVAEGDLPAVDPETGKSRSAHATPSDTGTPLELDVEVPSEKVPNMNGEPANGQVDLKDATNEDVEDEVSDVGSDLDEDGMLAKYLATKEKLYEIWPALAGDRTAKKCRKGQPQAPGTSRTISKLKRNLAKLESDLLFDADAAEQRWSARMVELARERAERRRLGVGEQSNTDGSGSTQDFAAQNPLASLQGSRNGAHEEHEDNDKHDGNNDDEDDVDGLMGDLFGAVSSTDNPASLTTDSSTLRIRDFGKSQGLNARRVLQDACHARDSDVKIHHMIISKSAFACRSQMVINWSKDQTSTLPLDETDTKCMLTPRMSSFKMMDVATADPSQSEQYVSTVALFQLFSTSVKEEKVHQRLSPAWRDLWFELAAEKKIKGDASDRGIAKALQDLALSEAVEEDEDDDKIHTANLRKRANDSRNESRQPSPDNAASRASQSETLLHIWQRVSSTPSFQQMLQVRTKLPMWSFKDEVIEAVRDNQVTILCGETGCGKSTQMPSFILESQLAQGKPCKIYCTEPRRISAITLAQRVSQELGEHKGAVGNSGSLVGYSIRLESQVSSSTRLVFATTGIVLRMLESKDGFKDVTHVIVDEVHERSIETDFLLIILKSLIQKRPELKVVLMSATVDSQRFAEYFQGAPVLNVPGRTFPVETKYLEDAVELTKHVVGDDASDGLVDADVDLDGQAENDKTAQKIAGLQGYSNATKSTLMKLDEKRIDYELIYKLIEHISKNGALKAYSKAILVFLPGIAEIRRMSDMISGSPLSQIFVVHMLHSTVASEDQQRAFDIPPRGLKKIVLSTNIAETGVTIPDITCVIDTGKHKEMRFDEKRQISRLIESFISRANAKQRRGRAGRVQNGLAFHLFTKNRHDTAMAEQQTPEMLRLSLQDLIMRVKVCNLGDIQATLAQALDPPNPKNTRRAIDTLIEVGALTTGENLTPLGQQLAKLPLDPYLGKLIIFGALYGCLDVALTIAAVLTSKSPFVMAIDSRKQSDLARSAFRKGDSDLLTEYNAYASWRRVCEGGGMSEAQFCKRNMLSLQTLCNIEDLKVQLLGQLADAGFLSLSPAERSHLPRNQPLYTPRNKPRSFLALPSVLTAHNDNTDLVSTALAWSFYPKILLREGRGWRGASSSQAITLHPTSILRSGDISHVKFLSYYSVLQSGSGARNYNALSLTPASPLSLILFAASAQAEGASFHHTSLTISLDGGRIRFALPHTSSSSGGIGGMKTLVALKYLRRRVGEYMERRWKGAGGSKSTAKVSARLERWAHAWRAVIQTWQQQSL